MIDVQMTLNGTATQVHADPGTPLLYILRNQAGLNSPRYGCGQEQCGACRVLLDGKPVFSCTLPIEEVAGKSITTVEGLAVAGSGQLHPLQSAFLEMNAAQCGYCATGILMSAAALLDTNPNPTRAEIKDALKDHLCRCGAHNRIIRAIGRAAEIKRQSAPAGPR